MKLPTLAIALLVAFSTAPLLDAQGMASGPFWPALGAFGSSGGDVNGDGRDDLVTLVGLSWRVFDVATNTQFAYLARPATLQAYPLYTPVADFNGDGRDDLAHWDASSCEIVSGSDGSTLLQFSQPATYVTGGADFDGDGRADLFLARSGVVEIVSARTGLRLFQRASSSGITYTGIVPAGDENGDGYEDAALNSIVTGVPYSMMEIVRGPFGTVVGSWNYAQPIGDVTGDGRADFYSAPHPSVLAIAPFVLAGGSLTNVWSVPGASHLGFILTPGDVDGDGFADLAVTGASGGWQLLSGASHAALPGVVPNSGPVRVGDLDGDGRVECTLNGIPYEWVDPAVPISSRMVRRGTPGTTSVGRRPMLVARGHCGLGRTAFFDMRGGVPNGITLLAFGAVANIDLGPLGAPGNSSYTSLAGAFTFLADPNGVAQFQATLPVSPSLLGASVSLQAAVVDAAANSLGLVTSNAIDLTTNN